MYFFNLDRFRLLFHPVVCVHCVICMRCVCQRHRTFQGYHLFNRMSASVEFYWVVDALEGALVSSKDVNSCRPSLDFNQVISCDPEVCSIVKTLPAHVTPCASALSRSA